MPYGSVYNGMANIISFFRGDSLSRRQLDVHFVMDFIFQSYGFIFSKLFFLTYSLLPPAGMYWQKVEVFREYVAAVRSAVWILEAVASLGIRWLNVPVIAIELFSSLNI